MTKCPICQGTGFKDGKLCICITGDGPKTNGDIFDFLKGFGMTDKREDKSDERD